MRLFLLGATPKFDVAATLPGAARLTATGGNSGNQIIAHGLLKTVKHASVTWDYHLGSDWVTANCDHVLIAAANFLAPSFDFGGMAHFLEKIDLPVSIVGLGAQSHDFDADVTLMPGTERFLSVVAERCPLIGIRGEYTATVLERRGVKNYQVTGCPSYYMNGNQPLRLRQTTLDSGAKIAVNGSRDVFRHSFAPDALKNAIDGLIREAIRYDGYFVPQTEVDEIMLCDEAESPAAAAALARLKDVFKGLADDDVLEKWLKTRMRVYWDADLWCREMSGFDFVAGTRFHGCMAAIQMGTPAVILCHDTRTLEMASFLGLPHRNIKDLDSVSLAKLHGEVDADAVAQRYNVLQPRFVEFLAANHLTPC